MVNSLGKEEQKALTPSKFSQLKIQSSYEQQDSYDESEPQQEKVKSIIKPLAIEEPSVQKLEDSDIFWL